MTAILTVMMTTTVFTFLLTMTATLIILVFFEA